MIAALGGTKIAESAGTTVQVLEPLVKTAVNAYFVWFTADDLDDTVARFSRLETYNIFGPFSQTVNPVTVAVPDQGVFYTPQAVVLTCSEGAGRCGNTYYTSDGSDPTTNASLYSAPIAIAKDTTLKFFSLSTNGGSETVKTKTYTFIDSPPPSVPALGPWGLLTAAALLGGIRFFKRESRPGIPAPGPGRS